MIDIPKLVGIPESSRERFDDVEPEDGHPLVESLEEALEFVNGEDILNLLAGRDEISWVPSCVIHETGYYRTKIEDYLVYLNVCDDENDAQCCVVLVGKWFDDEDNYLAAEIKEVFLFEGGSEVAAKIAAAMGLPH